MGSDYELLSTVSSYAGIGLIFIADIVGLVVVLRRWHLGTGARLAAAAFAMTLVAYAVGWLYPMLVPFVADGTDNDSLYLQIAVFSAVSTLLHLAAWVLLILGVRTMLNDVARLRSMPPRPADAAQGLPT